MNEDWGLTERGFKRPSYSELLNALEYKARELFGSKANLTVGSPYGIFLRIFAWAMNLLFSLTEDVYNSRFIDTAAGTSLYNLGNIIGLRLLPAQKAAGYLLIKGRAGTLVPTGFLASTIEGMQYVVAADVTLDEQGAALAPVKAFSAGEQGNTAENTVTQIVNPDGSIDSVNNPKPIDGGRGRETDEQFRDRYRKSVDFAGGVNSDAITGALLQGVPSIYSALVFENDTDIADALGLPPHSMEAIVYGGLDSDIAQAIFRRKSAGIQTVGNVTVPVITASGQTVNVSFSRPGPVQIRIRISNLDTSKGFPQDGLSQIRQALIAYIGGDVKGGLPIGTDVMYYRLPAALFAVVGVNDFDLEIGREGELYGRENIAIGTREKAVIGEEQV